MKTFGIIGHPLGHSFSRNFFNEKFSAEGIDAQYVNFDLPRIEDFPQVIASTPDLCGLNVTIPYKQQVIPYLDEVDRHTAGIGAVNVIEVRRSSGGKVRLIGHNSDIIGFTQSLRPLLQAHHTRALVLGTGGASKAVYHGLLSLGIEPQLVSRTKQSDQVLTYAELDEEVMASHPVIVNTTPLGMYPKVDACADIPYQFITPRHLLYDVVYNPEETLFLHRGRRQGAITKNGTEMLLLQAYAAWDFWNGKKPCFSE